MCTNSAIRPDHNTPSNHRCRSDAASRPNLSAGLDNGQRPNFSGRIYRGAFSYDCRGVHTRLGRSRGVKKRCYTRPCFVGSSCHNRHCGWRELRLHVWMQDHGASHGLLKERRIAPVVEKTYLVGTRHLQRRYTVDCQVGRSRNTLCRFGYYNQREWPAVSEKPSVAYRGPGHIFTNLAARTALYSSRNFTISPLRSFGL